MNTRQPADSLAATVELPGSEGKHRAGSEGSWKTRPGLQYFWVKPCNRALPMPNVSFYPCDGERNYQFVLNLVIEKYLEYWAFYDHSFPLNFKSRKPYTRSQAKIVSTLNNISLVFQSENFAIMNFNFDLSANLSHSSYFSNFGVSNLPSSPGDKVFGLSCTLT